MPRGVYDRKKKAEEPVAHVLESVVFKETGAADFGSKREAVDKRGTSDPIRLELMRRIYVAKVPEETPPTWLHHADCPPKAPICADLGCQAFRGKEVLEAIEAGWWNDLPGDP